MKAMCSGLTYEAGDFYLSQGSKRGAGTEYHDGYTYSPRGYGWAENVKGSKLILQLEVEGQRGTAWVDRYFKDNIGKLTANRRSRILETMPSIVEVERCTTQDGDIYYVVAEDDLATWLRRTGL